MGLSASQARFLQLTGRKSNVEYQAQQINFQLLLIAGKKNYFKLSRCGSGNDNPIYIYIWKRKPKTDGVDKLTRGKAR